MWDVLYAIDASSSMGESVIGWASRSKIDAVKLAIVEAVREGAYPPGCRVGVITFSAATRAMGLLLQGGRELTRTVLPLTQVVELLSNMESVGKQLDSIQVGGATPSGTAIAKGMEMLYGSEPEGPRRIKKIILVTDERSNAGPRPESIVDERARRLVIIDVVAIGGKTNRGVLEKIAEGTGGKFTEVRGEGELREAVRPGIEVRELGKESALMEEARSMAVQLSANKDRNSLEFKQLLERAREERAKVNKRLMEVLMRKTASAAEVSEFAMRVSEGTAGKGLSMRDYAREVWPRASELPQLETLETQLRGAMNALAV